MTEATTKAKKAAPKPKTSKKAAPKAPQEGTFAVFATGGKQYLVSVGQRLKIEKILGEHKEGDTLTFDSVLMSGDKIGTPFLDGTMVTATLEKIGRYKTVDVIKYKQKSRYFKKYGHRQPYFEITIDSIK